MQKKRNRTIDNAADVARRRLVSLAASLLLLAAAADARPQPLARPWAQFAGIGQRLLVSEFINSYTLAGYRLKNRLVRTLDGALRDTQLEFEYRFSGDMAARTGSAVFHIRSAAASELCDPCNIYTESLAPAEGDYSEAEHLRMSQKLHAADHAAATGLLKKLKKNFRVPELPPEPCPDPFKCLAT